jgi:uncharacterized membrane protein
MTSMRIYRSFLAGGLLGLAGFAAALVVHGGWQAAAAALSIAGGIVFLIGFIALRIAGEHPVPARREPARVEARPRSAPAGEREPAPDGRSAAARPLPAPARHAPA